MSVKALNTLLVSVALLCTFAVEAAQVTVRAGGFYSKSNSSFQLNNQAAGSSRDLNLENQFDLPVREAVPLIALQLDFNNDHRLIADYQYLTRKEAGEFNGGPFTWRQNDTDYRANNGAFIASELTLEIASLSYGIPLWHENESMFGVSLGLHQMKVQFSLAGMQPLCPGQPCPTLGDTVSEKSKHPMVNLGLYGQYRLLRNFDLSATAKLYSIDTQNLDGRFFDLNAGVNLSFWKNFKAYVGYSYLEFESKMNFEQSRPQFNYRFFGPVATLAYRF
ncbi:hypothetical protein [Paraferrimonas sedimenticola]|uniref:DUF481 domain-containing protein n=1 Tax=Paraferrimonas sedimenticola TaxID=375674 RepID=A0AA37RK26_9GAMM|nr:hypothetical protein [Paraferrimonas sedimenticola]GLP94715.1 DUF481 domain-containing protein [Paraferrimonas sedimenticola]